MTNTPRSNAISPVVFMRSGGPDPTSQEQVNKSIGMCRLHGLHNTEATLRALSAALEYERKENAELKQECEAAWDKCGERRIAQETADAERTALKAELARLRALMEARDAFERGEPSQPPETGVQKRAFLARTGDKPDE